MRYQGVPSSSRRKARGGQVGPAEVAAHHAGAGDDQLAELARGDVAPLLVDHPGPQRRADRADREGRRSRSSGIVAGIGRRCRRSSRSARRGSRSSASGQSRAEPPQGARSGRPRRRTGRAGGREARRGRGRRDCASRARIDGAEYQTLIRRSARNAPSRAGSLPSASPIRTSVAAGPAARRTGRRPTGRSGTGRARRTGRSAREVEGLGRTSRGR